MYKVQFDLVFGGFVDDNEDTHHILTSWNMKHVRKSCLEPGVCHVTERCVVWLTPDDFFFVFACWNCGKWLNHLAPYTQNLVSNGSYPPRLYCPTCARDRPLMGRLSGDDFMDRIMFEKFDSLFDIDNYLIPELINLRVLHCDFSKHLRHKLDQLDITIFDSIATYTNSVCDGSDSEYDSEPDSVLSFSSSTTAELTDSSTDSILLH